MASFGEGARDGAAAYSDSLLDIPSAILGLEDVMEAESAHKDLSYSPLLAQCLTTLQGLEPELQKRGVLHIGIFGSVARGDDDDESDVDVIVQVDYDVFRDLVGLLELKDEFSKAFARPVDVVSMGGLKSPKHDHIRQEMVLAF
jgi:uncharacterized protein